MNEIEKHSKEEEINLKEIISILKKNKKFIIICSVIAIIIGCVVALGTPKEYTSKIVLISDTKGTSSSGSMGSLAAMAGINLTGMTGSENLSPELYPEILFSTPFISSLFSLELSDEDEEINTTLYDYILHKQKTPWWNAVVALPRKMFESSPSKEPLPYKKAERSISNEEMGVIEKIKQSYFINTDKKTNITTIEVTFQSPEIAAFMADTLASHLQDYVIRHRTKKAQMDLDNTEKLFEKSKADYYKAQDHLAAFLDGNINVISARYKIHQEKLQNELNLSYSLYNQMAQQVQLKKIKVQDETPMFTVIQPAIEPLDASKPKRKMIVLGFLFVGFVGSCGWVIIRSYMKK